MKIHARMFLGLFALAASFPLALPCGVALAQPSASSSAAPRISGFDVKQVRQLVPGTELEFTLYGTPGAQATIRIAGADGGLVLQETELGLYQGSYTVKTRDRIAPDQSVTANLRLGNRVASMVLDEPLVSASASRAQGRRATAAAPGTLPRIDRFDVEPSQLAAGTDLVFVLRGTPGGNASVRIADVPGRIFLEETQQGLYEGAYTITQRDRIAPNARVTANLRIGDQRASAVLGHSLVSGSVPPPPGARRVAQACINCGVVEAINVVEVKGDGNFLGMIAGGVAGALLGSQVGSGSGRKIATVAGAAGGAYAGNEIEKRMKTTKHYEVLVRLENGGTQTISYPTEPGFRVGTRVRVENGSLVAI